MDITQFSQINPPQRLLMGPGPINADPRVLRAMSSQLVGQYDPAMTHYMNEVMALYRVSHRKSLDDVGRRHLARRDRSDSAVGDPSR